MGPELRSRPILNLLTPYRVRPPAVCNYQEGQQRNFTQLTSKSCIYKYITEMSQNANDYQGRIQDFKLGGAHLRKSRRAEGGAKFVWVFRVKKHDFTKKKSYFFQF